MPQRTMASCMVRRQRSGSPEPDGTPQARVPPYPALKPARVVAIPTASTKGPGSTRHLLCGRVFLPLQNSRARRIFHDNILKTGRSHLPLP